MLNALISCATVILYALLALAQRGLRSVAALRYLPSLGMFKHKSSLKQSVDSCKKTKHVIVIGGGIAGTACAWSLTKSNAVAKVTLIEQRDVLGGNAKTFEWQVKKNDAHTKDAAPVRTGLSVLAWPEAYFKNYTLLLKTLGLTTVEVTPKFYVSADGLTPTYRQGETSGNKRWHDDQRRWDRAIAFVRRVNAICFSVSQIAKRAFSCLFGSTETPAAPAHLGVGNAQAPPPPSMYEVTLCNPMNIIPARWLCRWAFGVSDDFWHHVVVPVYSSSFLTTSLNQMPAVILPPLDDIISVGYSDPLKPLKTWAGSSKDVFDEMAAEIGAANILLGVSIQSVVRCSGRRHGGGDRWAVTLLRPSSAPRADAEASSPAATPPDVLYCDEVVFACPASAVDALTNNDRNREKHHSSNNHCGASVFRNALFDSIIPNVRYENERDTNFLEGFVHADRGVAVAQEAMRSELIAKQFTNYVEVLGDPAKGRLENTFVLGTWVPAAVAAALYCEHSADAPEEPESDVTPQRKSSRRGRHRGAGKQQQKAQAHHPQFDAPPSRHHHTTQITDGFADMFVTYNPAPQRADAVRNAAFTTVDNRWAHPQFTLQSMGLSMALPLLQGRCGAYYCASYTTPGNGHDLSFLSGLAVAHKLTGGYYPFNDVASPAARRDFDLLRGLLFW